MKANTIPPFLHNLPLGEPLPPEEIDRLLRQERGSRLLLALMQRLRDRAEGSAQDAGVLSFEGKPGIDYQLGAAAALREFALDCWAVAHSPENGGGPDKEREP